SMSSTDDLPPALPAMWRALKRGYEAAPSLLSVSLGLALAAALPDALLALWFKLLADGVLGGRRGLVTTAAVGLGVSAPATWVLRLGVTVALLVSIHPALALLAAFALPTVLTSTWRPGVERAAEERGASANRLARHLFDVATTAPPGKEVRVTRIGARLVAQRRAAWERWHGPAARARRSRAGPCSPRPTDWATASASSTCLSLIRGRSGWCSTTWTSASRRARWSPLWERTAPARRRW